MATRGCKLPSYRHISPSGCFLFNRVSFLLSWPYGHGVVGFTGNAVQAARLGVNSKECISK